MKVILMKKLNNSYLNIFLQKDIFFFKNYLSKLNAFKVYSGYVHKIWKKTRIDSGHRPQI